MTFIPNVLSKRDEQNSGIASPTFLGVWVMTTGYNSVTIQVLPGTISNNSTGTLTIKFSPNGTVPSPTISSTITETIFLSSSYSKVFTLLDQYYYVNYTGPSGSATVISRLNTSPYSTTLPNSLTSFTNETENKMDAFGKLRTTSPYTLLDIRVPGQDSSGLGINGTTAYKENKLQMTSRSTGTTGSGSKVSNNSTVVLSVTGDYTFTNQSRTYCVYQPGKSLLIKCTGVMDAYGFVTGTSNTNPTGMRSRIGYFDDYNGLYFEYTSGSGASVIIRKEGTIVEQVSQTSWNIDPMNGTGPSGCTLSWTQAQLFIIDMEWLGVGRVRFGFFLFGKIQYCHEIPFLNVLFGPYVTNINLPIRYELQGPSPSATQGAMIQLCSTVISEGGYQIQGKPFSISVTNVTTQNNTEFAVFFLRGGNSFGNYYHQIIQPTQLSIASTNVGDIFVYTLHLYLPEDYTDTLTWNNVDTNSVCQYARGSLSDITGTSITVLSEVASGRGSNSLASLERVFNNILQITSSVNNKSAVLALRAIGTFSGQSKIFASLNWNEIY